MTLLYLAAAWLVGIVLAAWVQPRLSTNGDWLLLMGLLTPLPLAVLFLWREHRQARLLGVCGLFLLAGAGRYFLALPHFDAHSLATYNDRGWATLVGVVAGEPDVRDTYVNLRLRAETLTLDEDDVERRVTGVALVRAPRYPEYRYGDRLRVRGQIRTPPEFESFSYKDYLARQGVYSIVYRPRITLLARGQGSLFWQALYAFKRHAQGVIAAILPEPQAALLTGILLGVETGIPRDLMADFSATGTTHIIAISGFNISIIAGLLGGLSARLFGKRRAAPFAIGGIALYTLFVGASAAVVRAAIMGALYVVATHFGRQTLALISLAAAAIVMSALSPFVLWDVGFQLSFAATVGLVLFTDPLQARFEALLQRLLPPEGAKSVARFLNEALIVTTAAQITTLPIIVYYFRQVSLVTLLTNLLILPAQTGVMLWGGVATVAGLIWLPLGQVSGWVAWVFLAYTIRMVELTARIPYAVVSVGRVGAGLVWGYYGLLLGGVLLRRLSPEQRQALWRKLTLTIRGEHRNPFFVPSVLGRIPVLGSLLRKVGLTPGRKNGFLPLSTKALISGLAFVVILVWVMALTLPDGKLHVTVLDVGQGDAIFIETPRGAQVLVDGGPSPTAVTAALGRRMPFWDRTIDLVVLTHPDADHLTGLLPVLERYRVEQVLVSGLANQTPLYEQWEALLQKKHIPVQQAQAGMQIVLEEGLTCLVLHPGPQLVTGTDADSNNNSVVLRLTWGKVSFLLPGDIEAIVEEQLVRDGQPLASMVFKVPHHGADTSSSAGFLDAVAPRLAVISVGADNRFGHPAPEVLQRLGERGITVLRTDERGSVEMISDGEKVWVRTER